MTPQQWTTKLIASLDAARRSGRPVAEHELTLVAFEEATAELRGALQKIADSASYQGGGCGTKLGRAIDIARKALGQ